MIISLIAALADNRVIGMGNAIPWHIPADLAWFRHKTLNKPVIMGRKTFKSMRAPLPNRHNIVLSSRFGNEAGVTWVNSLDDALEIAGDVEEVIVMGGGCIYRQFITHADCMYLTHIGVNINGDTYFPEFNSYEWKTSFSECHNADALNIYSYCFEILERN